MFYRPVKGVGAFYGEGGVGAGRQDVLDGHGESSGFELLADHFGGAAALGDVAVDAAGEADAVGGMDVDGGGVEREELGVVEGEDAFDDDDAGGSDGVGLAGDAGVSFEVVDRALDGQAAGRGRGRGR